MRCACPDSAYDFCIKRREEAMKSALLAAIIGAAMLLSACGNYSGMAGNTSLAPTVSGAWTVVFTPTAQGSTTLPPTTLTVNFTQNGNTLSGTVAAVNNPGGSCFPSITSTSTFTISGQAVAQMQSTSNLALMVAFTSGSSSGTVTGTGSLAYPAPAARLP
jgi:hypothetical protein